MTKAIWIAGAVIVVGIGIVAGVIFAGGSEQQTASTPLTERTDRPAGTTAVVAAPAVASPSEVPAVEEATAPVDESALPVAASIAEQTGPLVIDTLDELFAHARTYANKSVVVRGTIVTQCISGCTFSLEDGTAVIAVELIDDALDHVLDGGSIGRSVEVRGTVETSPQLVIVIEDPDGWNYID